MQLNLEMEFADEKKVGIVFSKPLNVMRDPCDVCAKPCKHPDLCLDHRKFVATGGRVLTQNRYGEDKRYLR